MGCRPSKQATSKVRAVDHKEDPKCLCSPRKVKKSSHKCGGTEFNSCHVSEEDQSVSNKQSFSSGHRPRSARSADNDFPAFSTTTAVYRKSASKTSKITLRLSCDGSTLEIEQCDYDLEKVHGESITKPRPWSSAPNLTKLRDCKARLFRDSYIPMKHSASAWSPSVNSTVSGARGGQIRVPVLISPAEDRMNRENSVDGHASYEPGVEDKTSRHKTKENSKAEAKSYSSKDFTKSKSSEREPLLQENLSKYSPEENISQEPHSIITRDAGETKLTHTVPNKNSRGVSNSNTLDNMIDQLEYSLELTHHIVHTSGPVSRRTRTMEVNYENVAGNSCQAQRSFLSSKQCHRVSSCSYTSDVSPEFEQIPVNVITSFIHPIPTNATDEKNGEHNVRMSGNHNSAITKADIYYPANQPRGTNEAGNGLRKDQMALPIHNDTSILPFLTSDCPGLKSKKSDRAKGKYTNITTPKYTENVLDSKKRSQSKSESSFRTTSFDTQNCRSGKVGTVNKGYMFSSDISSDNSRSSHRSKLDRNKSHDNPLLVNHVHPRLSSPPDPDSILTFVTLGCPVPTEMPSFMYAREDEAPLSLFTPQRHILYPYCDVYTDGPQSCRSRSTNEKCCGEDFHYDVSDEDCDLCRSYDVTDFCDKRSPLDNLTHSLIDNSDLNPRSHIRKTSNDNLYNMRANSCSSASDFPEGTGENKETSYLLQMEQQCLWKESGLWPDQTRSSLPENGVSLKVSQQVKYNGLSNESMRKIPSPSTASGLMQEHPTHVLVSNGENLDSVTCERKTDIEDKRKVRMTYTESYSDKLPFNENTCHRDLGTEVETLTAAIDTNTRSTNNEPENNLFDCKDGNRGTGITSSSHDIHGNSNSQYGIDLLPQNLMFTTKTDKTREPNTVGHCKRVAFSSEIMEPTLDYQLETHGDIYKHEISLATESADYLVELLNQDCQQLNLVSSDVQNTFRFSYDFDHSVASQDMDNLSFTDASDIEISPLTYQDLGHSTITSGGKDVSKTEKNSADESNSALTSMQKVKEGILQTNLKLLDPQISSAEEERNFYSFRQERCISCAHTLSGNVSPTLLLDDSDGKDSEDEVFYDAMRCEEILSQCDKGNEVTPFTNVCGNYMRDVEVSVKPCLDLSNGTNPKLRSQGREKNKCDIMLLRQAILEQNVSRMASEGVEATWNTRLHNLKECELGKRDDTKQELYENGSNPIRTNSICDKNTSSPNECNLYTSISMTHNPWGPLTTASPRAGRQIRVESERSGLSIDAFTSGLGRPRENTESHQKGGSIDPRGRINLNPDEFPRHALLSRCNFNGSVGSAKERPVSSLVSNSIRNAGSQEDSTCSNELYSICDSDTEILDSLRLSDSPTTNSSKQSQLGGSLTKDGNLCYSVENSENARPCSCEETQGQFPALGLKPPSITNSYNSFTNPCAQDIPCVDFKDQVTKGKLNKSRVEQQHIDSVGENKDMFLIKHEKGNEEEKDSEKNVSGCNLLHLEKLQQPSFSHETDSVTNLLNSKLEQNKIFLGNELNQINPPQAMEPIYKKGTDFIEDLDVTEKCRSENEDLISNQSRYNQTEQETSLKTVKCAAKLQSDEGLIKYPSDKSLMQTSHPNIDPGEFPPPCSSSVSHSQSNGQYRKPQTKLNKLSGTDDLETVSSSVLPDGSTYQSNTISKLNSVSDSGTVNGSSRSQSEKRSQLKAECKLRADCQRRPRNNVLSLVRYFEKVPLVSKGHKK